MAWGKSHVGLPTPFIAIYVQVQSSKDRTAVPFSPQQSTPLVKATKHKANPVNDEVRVENQNHGLVWSQSGNNKAV